MLTLEELDVYTMSMEIANSIFSQVEKWEYFYQRTIGVQLVSAADSIAANISEGWGRYYYKENRVF
jgi:four helix bundle protein